MQGYIHDVKQQALENTNFRKVLETGKNTQIVVMSIPPGGEIGMETHKDTDQVLYFALGSAKAILNGEEQNIHQDDIVLVKQGTEHNIINSGPDDLKIITAYSPPHHPPGTIHKTKSDADKAEY